MKNGSYSPGKLVIKMLTLNYQFWFLWNCTLKSSSWHFKRYYSHYLKLYSSPSSLSLPLHNLLTAINKLGTNVSKVLGPISTPSFYHIRSRASSLYKDRKCVQKPKVNSVQYHAWFLNLPYLMGGGRERGSFVGAVNHDILGVMVSLCSAATRAECVLISWSGVGSSRGAALVSGFGKAFGSSRSKMPEMNRPIINQTHFE